MTQIFIVFNPFKSNLWVFFNSNNINDNNNNNF